MKNETEIPEDIKRAVEIGIPGTAEASVENIYRLAGLLVLAERERCAKAADAIEAEDLGSAWDYEVGRSAGAGAVAKAIRNPSP